MVDPAKTAEAIEVRTFGRWTDFRLPTALLWIAVAGGMLMLYLSSRLALEQLRDHEKRIAANEFGIAAHALKPAHDRTAKYQLELGRRIDELERQEEADALREHRGEGSE